MIEVDVFVFQQKIKDFFPDSNFLVLSYNGTRKPCEIQCLCCQKTKIYLEARKVFNQLNFCCSHYFKNMREKAEYFSKKYQFDIVEYNDKAQTITTKCQSCGAVNTKTLVAFKQYPNACSCKSYSHSSIEQLQERLDKQFPKEYQLLKAEGVNDNCLVKHLNCGFIFPVRCFSDLLNKRNRGCPKCYQFKSQGEKVIRDFLEQKNIKYIPQKTFAPLNKSKYRFDFYLPDYNLAIEYQGEQHYRDNGFFKDKLEVIQRRDEIKRKYCQENNIKLLEISYKDFKNINQIITSRLNDYPCGSRDKHLENDNTVHGCEDIV